MALNVHLGTVVGSEIKENIDGENTTRILSTELSAAEDVQSIEHIDQNGEQTNPLNDATLVILEISRTWKIAVAVKDLVEPDDTLERGEKKIYALDSDNNVVAWIYLRGDGSIRLDNGTGSAELKADGIFYIGNGDQFAALANLVLAELDKVKTDLDAVKSVFDAHIHVTTATVSTGSPGVLAAPSAGITTPHTPGSVASSNLKADE